MLLMAVVADEIVICDDSSRYTKKSLHKAGGEDQYDEDGVEFRIEDDIFAVNSFASPIIFLVSESDCYCKLE